MPRPFLFLLLLAALTAALAYYWNPDAILELGGVTKENSLAKTYLTNTRTLSYDQQGSLTEIMEASEVRFIPAEKHSLVTDPRYYSHNRDNQTWSVASDQGRFTHNREVLFLQGNVILTNDQNDGQLITEAMQVNLKTDIATSTVPVTIIQGPSTIKAKGMVADLNKEKIRMMPDVESIYVPAKP
jgi:lipopolysaccharide export system protein LptC